MFRSTMRRFAANRNIDASAVSVPVRVFGDSRFAAIESSTRTTSDGCTSGAGMCPISGTTYRRST